MSELKPCPFCGCEEVSRSEITPNMVLCSNIDCYFYAVYTPVMIWQSRPIEDELRADLARRDASLLTEGEQKEILSYIRGNYDRDKIPTWLLDLIDGIARRDEIIARLKEDAERLADIADMFGDDAIAVLKHRALMRELGNLPQPPKEGE